MRHDYAGAVHIHTKYSMDGRISVEDIIESAGRCGLDFIIVNDHDTIEAKKYEGWHGNVLVIAGEEISPRYNHYLAFNVKSAVVVDENFGRPQEYINRVNEQGGFGFIAHPDHKGNKLFKVKDYRWKDWNVNGYSGFCIWDLQNDWQVTLTGYPQALLSYLFPAYFLRGPKRETMERWDRINETEKKYCIGEVDNHESIRKYFGMKFKIFPFDFAFKTIRTHIVLEEPLTKKNSDIEKVLLALKTGNCYVSNDYFKCAEGFEYRLENNELAVKTPAPALIKIIRRGEEIFREYSDNVRLKTSGKGCYRCECYLKKYKLLPWIFSNPVFV